MTPPITKKPKRASKTASKTAKTKSSDKSVAGHKGGNSSKATKRSIPKSGPASVVNYTSALRWLYDHVDYERLRVVPYNNRTFSLERTRKLLAALGSPHQQLKFVHVAGTKGKGSCCAMLASMLQGCGYTVGLYTSPHLTDQCERISIDGHMISHGDMTDLIKVIAYKERVLGTNKPSFFEIMTAAALRYFSDQAVDIVVLETGLGGRLDSTNVVTPLVTGMTHISMDHMNILGSDLASIAREKAGIFKKGVAAVSVEQDPAVAEVLGEVAAKAESPLEFTGQQIDFSYRFEASPELGPHTRVCITTPTSRWDHVPVPLRGEHQAVNCGLALALIDKLKAYDFQIPEEKLIAGLSKTTLTGRMEQVWAQPRVIIDGAHNAASITALIRSLGAHINYDSLVMIFGCGQDKDAPGMLKQIALGADKIIFTRAKSNPRAYEPADLLSDFSSQSGKMAQMAPHLQDALQLARRAVSREDLIIITGSFYLVGEAKKYFLDKANKQSHQK